MHADMPRVAFYFLREVENLTRRSIALIRLCELRRFLKRAMNGDGKTLLAEGYEFCDGVSQAVRVSQGARDIAYSRAREHGAKRAYLSRLFGAVFSAHVINELIAAIVCEIHVDVRRARSLWIEKPLKRQIVCKGIHRRDTRQI